MVVEVEVVVEVVMVVVEVVVIEMVDIEEEEEEGMIAEEEILVKAAGIEDEAEIEVEIERTMVVPTETLIEVEMKEVIYVIIATSLVILQEIVRTNHYVKIVKECMMKEDVSNVGKRVISLINVLVKEKKKVAEDDQQLVNQNQRVDHQEDEVQTSTKHMDLKDQHLLKDQDLLNNQDLHRENDKQEINQLYRSN